MASDEHNPLGWHLRERPEASGGVWWRTVRKRPPSWRVPGKGFLRGQIKSVVISDRELAKFLAWAEKIPGWDETPIDIQPGRGA